MSVVKCEMKPKTWIAGYKCSMNARKARPVGTATSEGARKVRPIRIATSEGARNA